MARPPDPVARRSVALELDARADGVEDPRDLAAQEEQRNDRDDRDQGKDQRVLGETLALLVGAERCDESSKHGHDGSDTSFPTRLPGSPEAAAA